MTGLKIFLMAMVLALSSVSAFGDELLLPGSGGVDLRQPSLYYIGVHRPDGSCETTRVLADSLDDALKTAKKDCDICVTEDLTAIYRNLTAEKRVQVARTCPRY